jgi:ketosteroid isomerase-like protein
MSRLVGSMTDSEQVRQLLQRFARAADARDVEGLKALFHPDATVDSLRGKQAFLDWLKGMEGPRIYPTSMHLIGEPLVHFDGDTADLDSYAVVYQIGDRDAGQQDLTMGIRYLDQAVRDGQGWCIRARKVNILWTR